MTIKQEKNIIGENDLVRSRISDYWVFIIGMALVFLSNFSDLNHNNTTGELIPHTQESPRTPSPILEGICILEQEEFYVKSEVIR